MLNIIDHKYYFFQIFTEIFVLFGFTWVREKLFYDKLWFIYLEMPHFTKGKDELESHFERWLYLLKHLPNFDTVPKFLKEKIFLKTFKIAEIAKFNPDQSADDERSLKYYRVLKNVTDTAFDEGVTEGFEQGMEQGMA